MPSPVITRAFWLRQLHLWHWVSSAVCLVGMVLFAVTGITLNHAGAIEARPEVTEIETVLPDGLLAALEEGAGDGAPLPEPVRAWLSAELGVRAGARSAEWSPSDVYLSMPRPGGDAWLSIDFGSGEVFVEHTDRGWIAFLNDLHKGRSTGAAWSWFIDVFAIACVVFCLTGLMLLQFHARGRPSTWPMVGLGLVVPLVLILLFIH
ncbi:hypothetical protein FKB34_08065 [Glycocaulis profundi]|nr:hypothetical protein FKB34_08065 [Glycocaulis profundi]